MCLVVDGFATDRQRLSPAPAEHLKYSSNDILEVSM